MNNQIERNYYFGLDFVRFAAAALVTLFHLTWKTTSTNDDFWFGWVGVQIFFLLSGFVIANSANDTSVAKFVKSRFMRLYPGAIACALLSFLVLIWTNPINDLFLPLLKSLTLFPQGPFLVPAYWTLPIELAFYAAIAIILFNKRFQYIAKYSHYLTLVSCSYIIVYFCHCMNWLDAPYLELDYGIRNMTLLRHGLYFSSGIYLWLIVNGYSKTRDYYFLVLALLCANLEITTRSIEIIELINSAKLTLNKDFWQPIGVFFMALAVIIFSVSTKFSLPLPPWQQSLLRFAGLATYPLYLLHESVAYAIKRALTQHSDFTDFDIAIIAFILTSLLSVIVATKLEVAIRNRFHQILSNRAPRTLILKLHPYVSSKGGKVQ